MSRKFLGSIYGILERMITRERNVNLFYEAAFQEAIADGEVMMAVDVGGLHCVEIDTAEDLQSARALSALLRDASRP